MVPAKILNINTFLNKFLQALSATQGNIAFNTLGKELAQLEKILPDATFPEQKQQLITLFSLLIKEIKTLLPLCCYQSYTHILAYLIQNHFDEVQAVLAVDKQHTALFAACQHNSVDVLKQILSLYPPSAQKNAITYGNCFALRIAVGGDQRILDYLCQYYAEHGYDAISIANIITNEQKNAMPLRAMVQTLTDTEIIRKLHPDQVAKNKEAQTAVIQYTSNNNNNSNNNNSNNVPKGAPLVPAPVDNNHNLEILSPPKPSRWKKIFHIITEDQVDMLEPSTLNNISLTTLSRKDIDGKTLLYHAATKEKPNICLQLINAGAPVNEIYWFGQTILHIACRYGWHQVAIAVINKDKSMLNKKNEAGWLPIHDAAENGHLDIIKEIISASTETINAKTKTSATPLHLAARAGHLKVVNYLLQQHFSIKVSSPDKANHSPLYHAVTNGYRKIAITLIMHGADLHERYGKPATQNLSDYIDEKGWADVKEALQNRIKHANTASKNKKRKPENEIAAPNNDSNNNNSNNNFSKKNKASSAHLDTAQLDEYPIAPSGPKHPIYVALPTLHGNNNNNNNNNTNNNNTNDNSNNNKNNNIIRIKYE